LELQKTLVLALPETNGPTPTGSEVVFLNGDALDAPARTVTTYAVCGTA
jgi:hypothetical protein